MISQAPWRLMRKSRPFSEEKQPREAMEMISAGLRSRASKMRPDDLARLRQPLEKAASSIPYLHRCCSERCSARPT